MSDEKDIIAIEKAEEKIKITTDKNKMKLANKIYKKLHVKFLKNEEMEEIANRAANKTTSLYELQYKELEKKYNNNLEILSSILNDIEDYKSKDTDRVDFEKAMNLYRKVKEMRKQIGLDK